MTILTFGDITVTGPNLTVVWTEHGWTGEAR